MRRKLFYIGLKLFAQIHSQKTLKSLTLVPACWVFPQNLHSHRYLKKSVYTTMGNSKPAGRTESQLRFNARFGSVNRALVFSKSPFKVHSSNPRFKSAN